MKAPTTTALERARAAWGEAMPEWIVALAKACDATTQSRAAEAIGYSPAAVSQVLKRAYAGGLDRIEQAVRGAFMAAEVDCPGQGRAIPTNECTTWQRKGYDGSNHCAVAMFRACRSCPIAQQRGADAQP